MKKAVRSALARSDIQVALDFYVQEAPHVAYAFIDALEKAVAQIERQPALGSPRYALELGIPKLRHWRLSRFPYAIFYLEQSAQVSVIRLVHLSRDIPASLQIDESL